MVTTVVSSTLLGQMAAAHGVHYAETFTGFKWIAHAVLDHPELRFVFGYEQALGYLVTRPPLDKDGITAAVLLAEVAALAKADGVTLEDRLADIEDALRAPRHRRAIGADEPAGHGRAHGRAPAGPPARAGRRRRSPAREDFPDADLLRYHLDGGARVQVRPSGTEPKVKLYGEAVEPTRPQLDALAAYLDRARRARPPALGRRGVRRRESTHRWAHQRPNWRSPASPRPGTM